MISLLFFGSFQDYSVQVLRKLHQQPAFSLTGVVTTPPRPGNRGILSTTPVFDYAKTHTIPLFTPNTLAQIPKKWAQPDFLVVAGFGQLIPPPWLNWPKVMAVNFHQSLLPNYAGAFPAEWAILRGETQTGVTAISMSKDFDQGDILAHQTLPILPTDTRETLYTKLYDLSADLALNLLPKLKVGKPAGQPQPQGKYFYARRLTRQDGFVPWEYFFAFVDTHTTISSHLPPIANDLPTPSTANLIPTMLRALTPWPGVWTIVPTITKRLKLLSLNPNLVQLEGKNPSEWATIKRYLV